MAGPYSLPRRRLGCEPEPAAKPEIMVATSTTVSSGPIPACWDWAFDNRENLKKDRDAPLPVIPDFPSEDEHSASLRSSVTTLASSCSRNTAATAATTVSTDTVPSEHFRNVQWGHDPPRSSSIQATAIPKARPIQCTPTIPAKARKPKTDEVANSLRPTVQKTPFRPEKVDQYGFLILSVSEVQYDAWAVPYAGCQARRTSKWTDYMIESRLDPINPFAFPGRCAKTQRFVRKGLPPAWRGAAWFHYAGGQAFLDRHPQLYANLALLSDTVPSESGAAIERDLERTFPNNIRFNPGLKRSNDSSLLLVLRRVLRAFALHQPKIGYCQSLNQIAGMLLLFLPEDKTFWMLHIITTVLLPSMHRTGGANIDLWVFMNALQKTLPAVWAKVTSPNDALPSVARKGSHSLPAISLITTTWFMALFIGSLPTESVLRVWDMLFYEGSQVIFRVALAVFKDGERWIRDVQDLLQLSRTMQQVPQGILDANALLQSAMSNKFSGITGSWIEEKRRQRQAQCHARKQRSQAS